MTDWLRLTDEQRRETLAQTQLRSGIPVKAIEKDWWVTLVLKALFQSAYAEYMVFKGGTSLSKCWKIINRFSEDIDIALAPEAFGMRYEETPTKGYVGKLKRNGCEFTSTKLLDELSNQLAALGLPEGSVIIEAEPVPEKMPDTDPQTLHVKYKSLYDPNPYIADEVKIEVSVRSLKTPFTKRPVLSILSEVFPNPAYAETAFEVAVVEPRKTFLEKAFLLHEEFGKPDKSKIRTERMSRHFYDLVAAMQKGIETEALSDHGLYDGIIIHRQQYSRMSWVNYPTLDHSTISFLPPPEVLESFRQDYEVMMEQMIYGEDVPTFDELLEQLKLLQGKFRLKKEVKTLEEVIRDAENNLADFIKQNEGSTLLESPVIYTTDPYKPASPENKSIIFVVQLSRNGSKITFENIHIQKN
jgi:hypothetical protein